jgi:predicted nicotinamide N-methyase
MSYSEKALQQHVFSFGDHDLRVVCRRLPGEVSRVTQTLQLDVEELFASVLDFDIGKPAAAAAPCAGGSGRSDQQSVPSIAAPAAAAAAAGPGQPIDSKKLCGNVASDQPDLIGMDVWPASIALCHYLVRRPQLAAGAAVCELGAGMGLPGLLCAQLGAASVLLTDYEPLVVEQLRQNAALNSLQQRCCFQALDWFDLAPLAPAQHAAHDLVLLADVIYAAAVVEPLVQTLLTLLRPGTGAALAGKPPCVTSAAATGTRLFCCLLCAWAALQIALHSRMLVVNKACLPCRPWPTLLLPPAATACHLQPATAPTLPRLSRLQGRRWWPTASAGPSCSTGWIRLRGWRSETKSSKTLKAPAAGQACTCAVSMTTAPRRWVGRSRCCWPLGLLKSSCSAFPG